MNGGLLLKNIYFKYVCLDLQSCSQLSEDCKPIDLIGKDVCVCVCVCVVLFIFTITEHPPKKKKKKNLLHFVFERKKIAFCFTDAFGLV